MEVVQPRIVAAEDLGSDLNWKSIIAGALGAAALSFVLLTFGTGLGLAVSSASPTWRDSSTALWVLSGVYLIFIAIVSFGLGGYITGRLRPRGAPVSDLRESEFRDGMNALVMWALAIVLGAVLAILSARALAPAAVPGGSAGPATSVAGENTLAYELDQLFRSNRMPRDGDMTYTRAEAARILLTSSGHSGVSSQDRDYLVQLVSARAGVPLDEADARVREIIPRAHDALKRVRESGVMIAFMTAAALLIGAVVAWLAAREGGREREAGGAPAWRWSLARPARL